MPKKETKVAEPETKDGELSVQYIPITKLKTHLKNPRLHPQSAIDKVAKSILQYGWTSPIIANKENVILAGHVRFKAAQQLQLEEVPVVYINLTGAKADAYVIADNRLNQDSTWDFMKLEGLVKELKAEDYDLTLTGMDGGEIDQVLQGINFTTDLDMYATNLTLPDGKKKEKQIFCPNCGADLMYNGKQARVNKPCPVEELEPEEDEKPEEGERNEE